MWTYAHQESTAQILSSKNQQVQFFFNIIFMNPTLNALVAQMPPSYVQSFHIFIKLKVKITSCPPPKNLTSFHYLGSVVDP